MTTAPSHVRRVFIVLSLWLCEAALLETTCLAIPVPSTRLRETLAASAFLQIIDELGAPIRRLLGQSFVRATRAVS
jgi:hypothetical protein